LGDLRNAKEVKHRRARGRLLDRACSHPLVRSGNADINVGFTDARIGRAPEPPGDASLRALTAAMARDVLAALSRPV
jgi:hypothetical protein